LAKAYELIEQLKQENKDLKFNLKSAEEQNEDLARELQEVQGEKSDLREEVEQLYVDIRKIADLVHKTRNEKGQLEQELARAKELNDSLTGEVADLKDITAGDQLRIQLLEDQIQEVISVLTRFASKLSMFPNRPGWPYQLLNSIKMRFRRTNKRAFSGKLLNWQVCKEITDFADIENIRNHHFLHFFKKRKVQ
jgi:FtsZ-binding cell division protein ZapB